MFNDPMTQASYKWMERLKNAGFSPTQVMQHIQSKMRDAPIVSLSEGSPGPTRRAIFVNPQEEVIQAIEIDVSRKAMQALLKAEKIEDIWLPDGTTIFCDENGRLGEGMYHAAKFLRGQILGPFVVLGPLDPETATASDSPHSEEIIRDAIRSWVHKKQKPGVSDFEAPTVGLVGAYSHVWIDGEHYSR